MEEERWSCEGVYIYSFCSDIAACSPLSAIIPTGLLLPLLKHSSNSTPLQGYHSGRRSALVYMDESWFRLKGCGDHVDGITTRDVEDGSGRFSEIRGVQFENTTAREICILITTKKKDIII